MSANEVHIGDIGTLFKINVKDGASIVILTGTASRQIIFKRPDGTTVTATPNLFTDGTDGILTHVIATGTFNQEGTFKFQIQYSNAAGMWHSDLVPFDVYPNLT